MEYFTIFVSLVAVALATGIALYFITLYKMKKYWKDRGVPVELSHGFISMLNRPLHELFLEAHQKHGRIYGSFEFQKPVLTVSDPDLLRDILVKDFHLFNFRRDFQFGEPLIEKMVSSLKGEDWKRVRTIITPAFTARKMRQMSHIINECSKTIVETFREYAESGKPVDCKSVFGAFTLDVIASAAFATKIDSHNDPENIFVRNSKEAFAEPSPIRFFSILFLPIWCHKLFGLKILLSTNFFKDVVLQVIEERRKTGNKYDDILQLMMDAQEELENGTSKETGITDAQGDEADQYGSITSNGNILHLKHKKLYEDELVAQCILFFIVGYETTASTLGFLAYALALNPECQEKLIKEVDEIFEKHEELDYDVIRDMKYLDCTVSETLRMYPSVTRSERTACEDYKLGNTGITIEKGTIVGFNIYAMHHDPELFTNPETFYPERFMSKNVNHHQYAYLPFGAGPRNCLGMRFALMEIKLCITNILRYYKFKKSETTKVPLKYKKAQGFLSVNTLPLIVERRNT